MCLHRTIIMSKPSPKTLVTLTHLHPENTQIGKLANLDALFQRAAEQHALIKRDDRATTLRALFLGLLLYQIKNECEHGQFMKMATERLSDLPQRTRQDYMKLAYVYVEKTKLALPERLTIPDAQMALQMDGAAGTEREMIDKAMSFIGELSLHELMIKYDIRAVGLKGKLSDEADAESDAPLPPDEELRRRREQLFGECAEHVMSLHKTLTTAEELMLLDPTQLDSIDSQLIEMRAAIAAVRKPSA